MCGEGMGGGADADGIVTEEEGAVCEADVGASEEAHVEAMLEGFL